MPKSRLPKLKLFVKERVTPNFLLVTALYLIALALAVLSFGITPADVGTVGILSEAAIIATFGAALLSASDMAERDRVERVKQNTDILFEGILETEKWTRWPFLRRDWYIMGKTIHMHGIVRNPQFPFMLKDRFISIHVPTVVEDFFDLPVFREFALLRSSREPFFEAQTETHRGELKAALAKADEWFALNPSAETYTPSQDENEDEESETAFILKTFRGLKRDKLEDHRHAGEIMAYQCLFDSYECIVWFRLSRLLKHFSIGLILSSVICVTYFLANSHLVGFLTGKP